jgi:SAM-dependent methyltransferase
MKIHFTYSSETKEEFESKVPMRTSDLANESVDEISGQDVLEKIPDLVAFVDECYRILKPGGKCNFSSPFYASSGAWVSPITVRGISERTLNFASKVWREQVKFSDATVLANFDVVGQVAIEETSMQRAEEVRAFWLARYLNTAQAIMFTLTKV